MRRHVGASSGLLVAGLVAVGPVNPARAGFIDEAAFALGYIGFNIEGQRMPLGDGFDLLVSRTFVGDPLDFGPWDVTLQGPLSLSVNVGGRGLREWEISLNTAANENVASSPLSYVLNVDGGSQETQVRGNLFIDGDLKINNFGFYELNLAYSSRQTAVNDGRFANSERDFDFDVGPIVVTGNIYADILAVLTEPLFQAAGRPNPFANFSATSKIQDALELALGDFPQQLADGLLDPVSNVAAARLAALEITLPSAAAPHSGANTVPEPAVLFLMAAVIPVLLLRRRKPAAAE